MKNIESKKFYRRCHIIAGPVVRFFRPFEVAGRGNIPRGAVLICANHSAMIDPILVALALDKDTNVHVFAKAELFKVPVISWLIRKLGAISVDRNINDITSIKTSLTYLKNGQKVVIFPEGTRLREYNAAAAKSGAVKLAERAGVPVLPVYIPRRKPFFRKSMIVFGQPYSIGKAGGKRTAQDYAELSQELMNKIQELGER